MKRMIVPMLALVLAGSPAGASTHVAQQALPAEQKHAFTPASREGE